MGKSGILYVVGTGPGSSELMTLGAVRTLQKCPVIFYPVTQSKSGQQKSRALETVKGAVDLGKKILFPLEFSMRKNDSLVYEDANQVMPGQFQMPTSDDVALNKEDCKQTALLDCLQYWRGFDPEKSNNPFAYFTSVITNGYAKGWNTLYP